MTETRFTLSLPPEIYEQLRDYAEKRGSSIKGTVQQALKFGLVAMEVAERNDREIIFREITTNPQTGETVYKDKNIMLL